MVRFIVLALAAVSSAFQSVHALSQRAFLASESALDFDAFVQKHDRGYQAGSSEYNRRKRIYDRRAEAVLRHNSNPQRLWTAGINHLSDATDEEFQVRLGWRHHNHKSDTNSPYRASLLEITPPENFGWSNLTMASLVRDQGACGSCWAVATAATLEANYEIAHGTHRSFSAQELVDCVSNPLKCGGKGGCDGATVELGMDWAVYNSLKTLDDSPYLAQEDSCKSKPHRKTIDEQGKLDEDGRLVEFVSPTMRTASLASGYNDGDDIVKGGQAIGLMSFTTLPTNKYLPLIEAVMKGPVGVTVAADKWNDYASGIFTESSFTVNHAVLLMGFGKDPSGTKYYQIRNSWGEGWGESGFIRLLRTDDEENICGIDKSPLDGVGCDGGPPEVKVCGTSGILYDSVVPNFQKVGSEASTHDSSSAGPSGAIFKQN